MSKPPVDYLAYSTEVKGLKQRITALEAKLAAMTAAAERLLESHCCDDGSVDYDGMWTECPECKPLRDAINPPQQEREP
jgi:hypothetical protein